MVRAVANFPALGTVGGLESNLRTAHRYLRAHDHGQPWLRRANRYKRSGLSFFGANLHADHDGRHARHARFHEHHRRHVLRADHFHPHSGPGWDAGIRCRPVQFSRPTDLDLIYPEIVAQPNETVNGVTYPNGFNLDGDGKPILSVQKLHFIYDPIAVMFTPNDLTHKYPLVPKQQVLALAKGQIQEGICWRSANSLPQRLPPANIFTQQILPAGDGMDRPNIIYSSHNRPVRTPADSSYLGMSVHSIRSLWVWV